MPIVLGLLVLLSWVGTTGSLLRDYSLDASAQHYAGEGLKRALVTFATARALNAGLSLVQGTEIAVEPFGVGVQLSVGQVLHPLNQMVGQFADLMLAASVAFGVMEVLSRIGSSWALAALFTAAVVAWGWFRWNERATPRWLGKSVMILLVVRFTVPVVSLGSQWIYSAFLADDYARSQAVLDASAQKVDGQAAQNSVPEGTKPSGGGFLNWIISKVWGPSATPEAKPDQSFFEKFKGEATAKVKALADAAEALTEHIVNLMVVFLLQTLVIPLILGWVLIRGTGALLQVRARGSPP
jgi:hypothetical protein